MRSALLLAGLDGAPVPKGTGTEPETGTGSSLHRVAETVAPVVEDLVVVCPDEQRSAVTEALADVSHRLVADPTSTRDRSPLSGPAPASRPGVRSPSSPATRSRSTRNCSKRVSRSARLPRYRAATAGSPRCRPSTTPRPSERPVTGRSRPGRVDSSTCSCVSTTSLSSTHRNSRATAKRRAARPRPRRRPRASSVAEHRSTGIPAPLIDIRSSYFDRSSGTSPYFPYM